MAKFRVCAECEDEFDVDSPEKKRVGGLKIHCPDCSSETTVKYAGFASGEGKQASVQIMKFETETDRRKYMDYWRAASGLNTGKNCQLAFRATEPNASRKIVITQLGNTNHKGKM
jgi:DNA-directed RNA polymerase subunit RPC12/RpoP